MKLRFGVHHPSDYYWKPDNLISFCEDLKRHHVGAYLLWANDLHLLELAKALLDHGIEVIYRPGLMRIPTKIPGGILEAHQRIGVKYCQYYNEPNLHCEWKEWPGKYAPERFAEHYGAKVSQLKAMGFTPVLAPLSPGGHIFHRDFFLRWMQRWKELGTLNYLLRDCVLGIHNRPCSNPPNSQDPCSFNEYKYWRKETARYVPGSLPMIACEAGYQPDDLRLSNGQWDWDRWKLWNLELVRRFKPTHPDYVGDDFLYHCFWILHDSGSTWDHCGLVENWFYDHHTGQGRTTHLWKALEREKWDGEDNENGGNGMGYKWLRDGLRGRGLTVVDLRSELWQECNQAKCLDTRRTFQDIKGVVVHHSTEVKIGETKPKAIALYHIHTLGWKCPGYHIYIERDGVLTLVNKLIETADHCGPSRVEKETVGVCFIGNGTEWPPTPEQIWAWDRVKASLDEFVSWAYRCKRTLWVLPHKYVVNTQCPGFHIEEAVLDLRE